MTDPDPELVEQAAKAIWEASPHTQSRWGFVNNKDRGEYRHQARAALAVLGSLTRRYTWSWPGELTITGEPGYGFEVDTPEEARAEADPYMTIVSRWVSGWMPAAPVGGSGHNNGDQP